MHFVLLITELKRFFYVYHGIDAAGKPDTVVGCLWQLLDSFPLVTHKFSTGLRSEDLPGQCMGGIPIECKNAVHTVQGARKYTKCSQIF